MNKKDMNLQDNKLKNIGIYVHIPFCKSKCYYCNFNSCVLKKHDEQAVFSNYINSVLKEIECYSKKLKNYVIDTIYIGGGTPSIIGDKIEQIITKIKQVFFVKQNCEITVEVNPNTITEINAETLVGCGVNRVSVGLQSANNKVLKAIGRTHNKQDFINTIRQLKHFGINNISCDLMIGLPKQKLRHIKQAVKLAVKCGVNHISAYYLILEKNTPLYKQVVNKTVKLPDENYCIKMYNLTYKLLKKHNYLRYEVSNFCKPNYECKHNYNCWQMHSYIGVGAGAHSFFEGRRFSNMSNHPKYIETINNNKLTIEVCEKLTKTQLLEETIMLGLRCAEGINLNQIKKDFNYNLAKSKEETINNFQKLNLIKIENGRLKLTNAGFYVLNKIVLDLVS